MKESHHRAECHCVSRHVLAVLLAAIQFACLELVGWDWPTKLALGIHDSLRRFQLLSIKGLINVRQAALFKKLFANSFAAISLFDLKG